MKLKEVNLIRTIPAIILISIALLYILDTISPKLIEGFALSSLWGSAVAAIFSIAVRLGKLPWFEMENGKKHAWILWMEARFAFLRADFYRSK